MNWNSLVLIISFLLAALLLWQEFKRANKIHLGWRIVASLIAVAALACIILPVTYPSQVILTANNNAILLTPGFDADSLAPYQNNRIFTADKALIKTYPKVKLINLDELKADSPAITKLHVFGYGLNEGELQELGNMPVVFHPAAVPDGISNINWKTQIKEGQPLRIQGSYKNGSDKITSLVLRGLNTDLDTVNIPAKTSRQFELSTNPKNTGKMVYTLQAIQGSDTLVNEDIPVEIEPVKPLKILVLTASPDFETRFLKNWLAENGYGVAVRSAISKDKLVKEYVNTEALPLDHLSAAVLDKFDVVIGDLSVLKSLNTDEGLVLKQQVSQKGLGVIVRADSSSKTISWLQSSFPINKVSAKDQVISLFNIQDKKGLSSKLKIDPNYIRPQNGTQSLVSDQQAHVMVNSSQFGSGRLIFSALSNTFSWALGGNKNDYEMFWSLLISKAARKEPVMEQWSVTSLMPQINTPVKLQLEAATPPAQIIIDQATSAPIQNPLIPFQWNVVYWPSNSGWHSAKQSSGMATWWYAYAANGWNTIKVSEKISDTRQYAQQHSIINKATEPLHQKIWVPVAKIYFYLMLVMALTYLWVENKLVG